MNKKKTQASFVNMGSSSLLVIFLVLSLVTFATLSLSSSKSDFAFSERLAERKTSYYDACNKAEIILNQVDEILENTYNDSSTNYLPSVKKALNELTFEANGETVQLTSDFSLSKPIVSYDVTLNEKQSLSVILVISDSSKVSEGFYQVKQWKITSIADWNGDNTLTLIK